MKSSHNELIFAVQNGKTKLVDLLLSTDKYNCKINALCHNGCTALIWAVYGGHTKIIEMLLNHKNPACDVNIVSKKGTTALIASLSSYPYITKLILDSKYSRCNIYIKNQFGNTALDIAKLKNKDGAIYMIEARMKFEQKTILVWILKKHKRYCRDLIHLICNFI